MISLKIIMIFLMKIFLLYQNKMIQVMINNYHLGKNKYFLRINLNNQIHQKNKINKIKMINQNYYLKIIFFFKNVMKLLIKEVLLIIIMNKQFNKIKFAYF